MAHIQAGSPDLAQDVDRTPLVVDLDGTLVHSDMLHETFFDAVPHSGWTIAKTLFATGFSKAALKSCLADHARIDFATLPYNMAVLDAIAAARRDGRPVYLATATNRRLAEGVATSLDCFDGVFASDDTTNLKGIHKADALVAAFGERGFDYIGNDASDLAVWRHARQALTVGLPASADRALRLLHPQRQTLAARRLDAGAILQALRPHQYAKNALIFVPLLTAHAFNLPAVVATLLAFVAFSICASGVYLLNDLLDIQADRAHPVKKNRPIASGRLPIALAVALAPVLTIAAFVVAWFVSPKFLMILAGYYLLTNLYSFSLKKRMLVDVVALALLYTIRVFAGAAAIDVAVSQWLFTFSLLIFTALALVKRYTELAMRLDEGLADPKNRNYKVGDLPIIASLAAAAGMNSIMVLALYVASDDVAQMYARPYMLWGLCPLFLYWIARVIMLSHRRMMHDDPISFALKDDRSWVVGLVSIGLVLAAL